MKISYAITVCNELVEIKRLLDQLLAEKRPQDEIVILVDNPGGEDNEITSLLYQYESHNLDHMCVWRSEFDGHFGNWKNKLNSYCKGDYIFQIDADEIPNKYLIEIIPQLIEHNPTTELFFIPRINTLEGDKEEIKKYIDSQGWVIDDNGWINFKYDHQGRLYKNQPHINWNGKVHEKIIGTKGHTFLPLEEQFSLYHPKTLKRQIKQNNLYQTI